MAKREPSLYKFSAPDCDAGTITLMASLDGAGVYSRTMQLEAFEPGHRDTHAALHGYKQKAGDKGAKTANAVTGKVDPRVRRDLVVAEWDRLCDGGMWNAGSSGPGPSADTKLLIAAMCLAYPKKAREFVADAVGKMAPNVRQGLLVSDELRVYVDQARAEMARGVDTQATLAAFGLGDETETEEETEEAGE